VPFTQGSGPGIAGPSELYKFDGTQFVLLNSVDYGGPGAGYGGLSVYGSGATARIVLGVANTWGFGQVVQQSVDGGANWKEIELGKPGGTGGGWVDDIEIDPSNPDHISHVSGGGIVETLNASAATPTWSDAVANLEETATNALVTPPAGASYKFVNSAGDIGTWVQTDLAAKPTRGPTSNWSSGNAADVAWSDPQYIVGSGVSNWKFPNVKGFGFWSGDGGVTWADFATWSGRRPIPCRRTPRTTARPGPQPTCRRFPWSDRAGIAATAWSQTARTRTRSTPMTRAAQRGAPPARSTSRPMPAIPLR
jgi:hypothetical protein